MFINTHPNNAEMSKMGVFGDFSPTRSKEHQKRLSPFVGAHDPHLPAHAPLPPPTGPYSCSLPQYHSLRPHHHAHKDGARTKALSDTHWWRGLMCKCISTSVAMRGMPQKRVEAAGGECHLILPFAYASLADCALTASTSFSAHYRRIGPAANHEPTAAASQKVALHTTVDDTTRDALSTREEQMDTTMPNVTPGPTRIIPASCTVSSPGCAYIPFPFPLYVEMRKKLRK
ncbi:hypothetical protein B0H10DRAFT_2250594 [Mycena sp. CBHHK59/15]|nr:hypothetical protein B0H10DRAFT_2250594 [Mycena sp. CBHHK59/15]